MAEFILSSFADEASGTLQGQMDNSQACGIRYIEIRNVEGRSIADLTPAQAKAVKRDLDARGFKISSIGSPFGKIGITDDFRPHFDKFKRCVETAVALESQYMRIFSFYIPKGEKPETFRDDVMERLGRFADYSAGAGVLCCHENEKGIYGNSPQRCLDICKTFGGKIPGIFDPANFIQESFEPLPAYNLLEPYIEYMHVKDALLAGGSVTPAGKGDGHIPELIGLFSNKPGRRFLTVEPHLALFEGFQALEKDGASFKRENRYASPEEAYRVAVDALKGILIGLGYTETIESGGYSIWKK